MLRPGHDYSGDLFCLGPPAGLLWAEGPDAARFLQSQFTNELRPMQPGRVTYGLWLDARGHCQADSFLLQAGEERFCLVSYHSPTETIHRKLESHRIADEVELFSKDGYSLLSLPEAVGLDSMAESLGSLTAPGPGRAIPVGDSGGWLFRGRRSKAGGWELLLPEALAAGVAAELLRSGAREADAAALETLRIEAGIPSVPADCGPNDLPPECGLDDDAISYTKGCYLGQEVMSRLKHVGRPSRALCWLEASSLLPRLPADLFAGGRKVGEWRSGVVVGEGRSLGLGVLRKRVLEGEGEPLSLDAGGADPVRARPVPAPVSIRA